jgi:hypothetical protein
MRSSKMLVLRFIMLKCSADSLVMLLHRRDTPDVFTVRSGSCELHGNRRRAFLDLKPQDPRPKNMEFPSYETLL